jgi:hypothetical protein
MDRSRYRRSKKKANGGPRLQNVNTSKHSVIENMQQSEARNEQSMSGGTSDRWITEAPSCFNRSQKKGKAT